MFADIAYGADVVNYLGFEKYSWIIHALDSDIYLALFYNQIK